VQNKILQQSGDYLANSVGPSVFTAPHKCGKWSQECTKWDVPLRGQWTWTSIRRGRLTWRQIYAVPALCLHRACQLTVPSSHFSHGTLREMTNPEERTKSANSDHKLQESN